MSNVNLRIDKLQLRLRGVDPATARQVADHLVASIAREIEPSLLGRAAGLDAERLQLGTVSVSSPATAADVGAVAARAVGRGLNQHLNEARASKPA